MTKRAKGPGRPRLREGEPTSTMRQRIARSDRDLIERAAEKAGETLSDFVRWAAVHRALDELGMEVDEYHGPALDGEA